MQVGLYLLLEPTLFLRAVYLTKERARASELTAIKASLNAYMDCIPTDQMTVSWLDNHTELILLHVEERATTSENAEQLCRICVIISTGLDASRAMTVLGAHERPGRAAFTMMSADLFVDDHRSMFDLQTLYFGENNNISTWIPGSVFDTIL